MPLDCFVRFEHVTESPFLAATFQHLYEPSGKRCMQRCTVPQHFKLLAPAIASAAFLCNRHKLFAAVGQTPDVHVFRVSDLSSAESRQQP